MSVSALACAQKVVLAMRAAQPKTQIGDLTYSAVLALTSVVMADHA